MSKRPNSSKDNDSPPSKRPFAKADEAYKPGSVDLDSDPTKLIQNIQAILDYQKKAIPYLCPNRKKTGSSKMITRIQEGLTAYDDKLEDAKKIKVSIATFGALGKGKSFVLNHVLEHKLGFKDLNLLPSGRGRSKTPVPTKIKHGLKVEVTTVRTNERLDKVFSKDFSESSMKEAAECIKGIFGQINDSYQDLKCVDVAAPLPVFQYLKKVVKSKCDYQDVEVDIEFVDLPGREDNHGDAFIGAALNDADIILVFKNSGADREVKIGDFKEVFQRRKIFDYVNRPKFVIIANQDDPDSPIDASLEEEELNKQWIKLLELEGNTENEDNEEKKKNRECYKVVYERLDLTTAKEFLEKFQEESAALVFSPNLNEEFVSDLGEAVVDHVNKVILKKTIHPVMQSIYKDANIVKKRISNLTSNEKKASQASKFKPLESLNFKLCNEDEEFVYNFEDISTLNCALDSNTLPKHIHEAPDMAKAHDLLIDSVFKQDEVIKKMLRKLRSSLNQHIATLLDMSEKNNGLLFSDQFVSNIASNYCETKVKAFMDKHAGRLINSCLDELVKKKPSKKEWDDAEQRKTLLEDHFNLLVQHLYKSLEKGSRAHKGLDELLTDLRTTIDEMISWGLANDHVTSSDEVKTLNEIKKTNQMFSKFSLKKIHEVNPHVEHKEAFLDSKAPLPNPPLTSDEHVANELPAIDKSTFDNKLKKVFDLLKKKKSGALDELRRKLGLPCKSLKNPPDIDEFEWTRILLNVLQYDGNFQNADQGFTLPESCRVDLNSIQEKYNEAKKQLFAYQKSKVRCVIIQDKSVLDDTIRITINEAKDGLTALVSPALPSELKKLEYLDLTEELAPVFIPSIHYGPNVEARGNLYLEEDPWANKEEDDNDGDDTSVQESNTVNDQPTGLEKLPARIFCVVEPNDETKFRSTLDKKRPDNNISFRYVVLPQNGRGIGVSRSIIKLLAEALNLPLYWTIDDDIKLIREYNQDSRYWKRCTIRRALLYGQLVYDNCTKTLVKNLTVRQRRKHGDDLIEHFPAWLHELENGNEIGTSDVALRLMNDDTSHNKVKCNIFSLKQHFTNEMMKNDCGGDPQKEREWREAVEKYVEDFKSIMLKDSYKRIGRVSIGHEKGRRQGYYSRSDEHYRKSMQNYQMVLHNTEALKGFNYVTDDVILQQEESIVKKPKLRDRRHLGMKGEDKSLCKAMEFYGIIGYQVITVALSNQKLTNVFGRIGNSWLPEKLEVCDDETTSVDDETTSDDEQ